MPITGPPKASVDRITAVLHWPPGGRTLAWTVAWTMAGVTTTPSHTATARPSRAIATAGETPRARVTGPDQVCPSTLVQACTVMLLSGFCWYPAAACAPAPLTATDPPHHPRSCPPRHHQPAPPPGAPPAPPV